MPQRAGRTHQGVDVLQIPEHGRKVLDGIKAYSTALCPSATAHCELVTPPNDLVHVEDLPYSFALNESNLDSRQRTAEGFAITSQILLGVLRIIQSYAVNLFQSMLLQGVPYLHC